MKKSTVVRSIMLLLAAATLSGCIFPYWGPGDRGRHRGHGGDGYRGDGPRDRGDRRH